MIKNLKKMFSLLVAVLIMAQAVAIVGAADYQSEALNVLKAETPINLGEQIKDIQILGNHVSVREDGAVMFYGVTSGPPATFFAYNVDTGIIEDVKYLQDEVKGGKGKVSYGVDMDKEGILNITTQSDSMFFRYNPKTKEIKSYGKIFEETAVMTTGYVDSNNNYYFGTYPNAKLIKYDAKADRLVDLGRMVPTGDYARCVVGYKDKIFMSGIGTPTTEVVKYDIKTGKSTVLKNPSLEGKFTEADVNSSSYASTAGKYMFIRLKITNLNMHYLCVLDMEKEEWVDYIPKTLHSHTTDYEGDLVYFHNSISGSKGGLFTYNPETKEIVQVDGVELTSGTYLVAPKIVTLKDQAKYPGRTLIAGSNSDGIIKINLQNKTVEFVKDVLPAQATTLRTIKGGYNGDIILSAYMGAKVVIYDSIKEQIRMEAPMQQIEGIAVADGKYYFGRYGRSGSLDEFDPTKAGSSTNPKTISSMKDEDQDRVFNVTDAGEYIAYGSFPNYGKLGGNVATYNKKTGETKVFTKPVENQCIAGLAYKDGKLYVSTSIFGGLGIDAIAAPAKMLIIDLKTSKIEKQVDVKLTTDKNEQYFVGDMIFDANGKLWVACSKTLLEVNPKTLAIVKEIPIGAGTIKADRVRALPYSMAIGQDGLLYTNLGNRITAIDTKTYETKELAEISTNAIALSTNGNLYYVAADQKSIDKIVLTRGEKADKLDMTLKASTVLYLGSSNSLAKGEKKQIDPDNSLVVAQTVNGRTLVPVRFIAENYGAKVEWDDATQTVTLSLPSKTVNITLNQNVIKINDKEIAIDVPAQTIQDRTMLPLRAFAEQVMGKKVFWDDRGLIVISDSDILNASSDAEVINQLIEKVK